MSDLDEVSWKVDEASAYFGAAMGAGVGILIAVVTAWWYALLLVPIYGILSWRHVRFKKEQKGD